MDPCPASISSAAQVVLRVHAESDPQFLCLDSSWNAVLSALTAGEQDRVGTSGIAVRDSKIVD